MKRLVITCIIAVASVLPVLGAGSAPISDEPAVKKEPAKKEPAKKEPAKKEPAKKEPAKKEPAKKEPSKKEAVKEESPAVRAYNEGVGLMQNKRFAQAQPKFEQAIKLDPDFAEAYNNLAFVLRKQGSANFPKSLAYYNKAIELEPKLAEAYMYRGVLYTQMGRKRDAQADLATLKKLNRQLAKELEEFMQTGKEEDYLYGAVTKKP
jgi:tetratricopeptide (TPR) repeat protein